MKEEDIKKLPNNIIRLCHNEYIRRWRKENKDKVKLYNTEHYKKYKITLEKKGTFKKESDNTFNPLDIERT